MNPGTHPLLLASAAVLLLVGTGCSGEEEAPSGAGSAVREAGDDSTEVLRGEVSYLGPGEYAVGEQAFSMSSDTLIFAGIHACLPEDGPSTDGDGNGVVECSHQDFEAFLQEGSTVLAEVKVEEGVADSITEYEEAPEPSPDTEAPEESEPAGAGEDAGGEQASAGDGFTGALAGQFQYVGPGEYAVDGQSFLVTADTKILAGLYACPVAGASATVGSYGDVPCGSDLFEQAMAAGTEVFAEVAVTGGTADSIAEYGVL
ncbi:hypothetical protein ACOALZ_00420 [Nocardiopsis algeriensis]|uniref:hypothetical protein n=1 Tax=Nocardiopsis algeriensis TaxID=1478215 RepID=UPI003B430695